MRTVKGSAIWLGFLLGFILLILSGCGGGGGNSLNPIIPPVSYSLSFSPGNVTVYPGSTFSVLLKCDSIGTPANPSVTLGSLPSGLTTTTAFPIIVPATGATITFKADNGILPGNVSVVASSQSGKSTVSANLAMTVQTGTPPSFTMVPVGGLLYVVRTGDSTSVQFQTSSNNAPANYDLTVGIAGLPTGVSAQITPTTVAVGQNFTLTLTAQQNAPISQNTSVTLTGAPAAVIGSVSQNILVEVSPPPGSVPNNRTDYTWLRATPYDLAFDAVHNILFASNLDWNRIDVVSNSSHAIVNTIPIRAPRGLSLSIDGTTLWVATASQQIFGIDTSTLIPKRYVLPSFSFYGGAPESWEGQQLLALADGTLMMLFSPSESPSSMYVAIWDPNTNTLTPVALPQGPYPFPFTWGLLRRSSDGKYVIAVDQSEYSQCARYDVLNKTLGSSVAFGSYAMIAAVNNDGSRIAMYDLQNGAAFYDGNCNLLSTLPGGGLSMRPTPSSDSVYGGFVFSVDGSKLYEVSMPYYMPLIYTIDVASMTTDGVAPAIPFIPTGWQLDPLYFRTLPVAVDSSGMLVGIQYQGIAFEDATFYKTLVPQVGPSTYLQHMSPYFGPLSGGTTSGGFGAAFAYTPDVFYGSTRGTASRNSSNLLSITSPPSSVPGPVNVKMLSPDGTEIFNPVFFTYGVKLLDSITSGAAPEGNSPGQIVGFGLPSDLVGTSISVGGTAASITSPASPVATFIKQLTATSLQYTIPPGQPGWANVVVNTPSGSDSIAQGVFYAKSVTEYPSSDQFQNIQYDSRRQQLYISTKTQIDVFSLTSKSFLAPIIPPSLSSKTELEGLAMTPGGAYLLVANLLDGSVAVVDPDTPTNSFAIAVAAPQPSVSDPKCMIGPAFVAATNRNQVIIVAGGERWTACTSTGQIYVADLTTKALVTSNLAPCLNLSATFPQGTSDGTKVAFTTVLPSSDFILYDSVAQSCPRVAYFLQPYTLAIAGDGNVIASTSTLLDGNGMVSGELAEPESYYPSHYSAGLFYDPLEDGALQSTKLNDSGSLYYWANPRFIDIFDVLHGRIQMRFSLPQTVQSGNASMAIDSSGRQIFLITAKGITIVDLGSAPLAIGHLSATTVSSGTQIQMRGSGFDSGTTVTIGGAGAAVTLIDESTLTFTLPSLSAGVKDIKLQNTLGTSYVLENALIIQ